MNFFRNLFNENDSWSTVPRWLYKEARAYSRCIPLYLRVWSLKAQILAIKTKRFIMTFHL